jgi:formate dehydrogenase subunit delta
MANQIADFFRPYPEEKAIAGVQEHIRSFWTPRMRKELFAHAAAGGKGLHPQVLEAIRRSTLAESPIEKVTAGPKEVGQMASDAG